MRSTGILVSAATIVVLIAHLCDCAAQKSGSLRSPKHHDGDSHHDASEKFPIHHHSPSTVMNGIPTGSKRDKHALKHALHLGKVKRHKHASGKAGKPAEKTSDTAAVIHIDSSDVVSSADAEDEQVKTVVHVQPTDGLSAADGRAEDNLEKDSTSSGAHVADDVTVADDKGVDSDFTDEATGASGDEDQDESMGTTDGEADDDSDDSDGSADSVDSVDAGSDEDVASESESRVGSEAASYRQAGAARFGQPPAAAPVPAPAVDNSTAVTAAPVATTAAAITGLPGQFPGNDGEVTMATTTAASVATAATPAPEGADGARTEPGSVPGSTGMDNSSMKDPAIANATGAADNSSAGESNSTVVGDWGEEYGDAAQAHDDDVAAGAPAGSSTVTVSAEEGQGSGATALVVGLVIILSLVAVALCLGTKL